MASAEEKALLVDIEEGFQSGAPTRSAYPQLSHVSLIAVCFGLVLCGVGAAMLASPSTRTQAPPLNPTDFVNLNSESSRSSSSCDGAADGKDNWGTNMNEGETSQNWQACQSKCQRESGCRGWSFKKGNNECWLKSGEVLHDMLPDEMTVSGNCNPVPRPSTTAGCDTPSYGQDNAGDNLKNTGSESMDWQTCSKWCKDQPECKGWTWKTDSHQCWLKQQTDGLHYDSSSISGSCP